MQGSAMRRALQSGSALILFLYFLTKRVRSRAVGILKILQRRRREVGGYLYIPTT